MSKYKTPKEID